MIMEVGELVKKIREECYRDFCVLADNQLMDITKPYYRFRLKFTLVDVGVIAIKFVDYAKDITAAEKGYFKIHETDDFRTRTLSVEVFANDFINALKVHYREKFSLLYITELKKTENFKGSFYRLKYHNQDDLPGEFFGITTSIIKYPGSRLTMDWLISADNIYRSKRRPTNFSEFIKYFAIETDNEVINFYLDFPLLTINRGETLDEMLNKYSFKKQVNIFNNFSKTSIERAANIIDKNTYRIFLFKVRSLLKEYNIKSNCNLELDKDIYDYIIKTLK